MLNAQQCLPHYKDSIDAAIVIILTVIPMHAYNAHFFMHKIDLFGNNDVISNFLLQQ